MISSPGVVLEFGKWIKQAEDRAIRQMQEGQVEDEPSLSGRFFDSLEHVFEDHRELQGYQFRVRNVRGIGGRAPEGSFGADACGILKIDVPGLQVVKGMLIQSKWARAPHITMNIVTHPTPSFRNDAEFRRMQGQCREMLKISPDSFVMVYSPDGFSATPASSIAGVNSQTTQVTLYSKGMSPFFKEFLMCFIGDPRINDHGDSSLKQLKDAYQVRSVLEIAVSKKVQETNGS